MTFLLTLPTKLTAILNWHLVEIRFNGDYFLIARTKKAGDEIGFVLGAGVASHLLYTDLSGMRLNPAKSKVSW